MALAAAISASPALVEAQSAISPPPGSDGYSAPKPSEPTPDEKQAATTVRDKPKPAVSMEVPAADTVRPRSGFSFGSYGRMIAATDFKGRPGRDADVVARGSRLDESNYVELELRRDDYWKMTESTTRVVATLAFANPIFHYNGDFNVKMAVRNLYIEERDLGLRGLSIWAGSRMYRGDDIYLLDFWPLDTLNTMGAGARYDIQRKTSIARPGRPLPAGLVLLPPAVAAAGGARSGRLDDRQRARPAALRRQRQGDHI